MSAKRIAALACVPLCALLSSSCAELDTKTGSTLLGAGIGCAAGAVTAKLTKNDATTGCAAGAVVGGAIGYIRARNLEVAEAKQATEAAARVPGATVTPVETQTVQVVDKETKKTETVTAFKSVSVEIPVSQLNTPDGREAVRKLEEYARRSADERADTIDYTVANPPATGGNKTRLVSLKEVVETAGKGKIRRNTVSDPRLSFTQRITIEAKNQSRVEV